MPNNIVVVLASSGFVGRSITAELKVDDKIKVFKAHRKVKYEAKNIIYFDLLDNASWENIVQIQPTIIIDCIGYGVVKNQTDLKMMYDVNYFFKRQFIDFIFQKIKNIFWIELGSAFEYSLEQQSLAENSVCYPKTHYGVSKLLLTQYLSGVVKNNFSVLRPFGMFGAGEDASKFIPMLALAQKNKEIVDLSDGSQKRDYFLVNDVGRFLHKIILNGHLSALNGEIINLGSGKAFSLFELSQVLKNTIPDFNPKFWNWGAIAQRNNESDIFFNASQKAYDLGFELTPLEKGFEETYKYYDKNYGRG